MRRSPRVYSLLINRQTQLGFKLEKRGYHTGYTKGGRFLKGLNPALQTYLYAKSAPKQKPRCWTRPGLMRSSKARGKWLDAVRDRVVQGSKPRLPACLQWYYGEIARRGWKLVTSQLIADWKDKVATACDEICFGEGGLIVIEVKSGEVDDLILHASFSRNAKFIRRGPFRKTPILDTLANRNLLQAAITGELVQGTYCRGNLRVKGVFVFYVDRREVVSLTDQSWYTPENLQQICALFEDV